MQIYIKIWFPQNVFLEIYDKSNLFFTEIYDKSNLFSCKMYDERGFWPKLVVLKIPIPLNP